jgi:hypothetical protein
MIADAIGVHGKVLTPAKAHSMLNAAIRRCQPASRRTAAEACVSPCVASHAPALLPRRQPRFRIDPLRTACEFREIALSIEFACSHCNLPDCHL